MISVRCTFPGFQLTFCYKYFAALPLPFSNERFSNLKSLNEFIQVHIVGIQRCPGS